MKSWITYMLVFAFGVGAGLGAPFLASKYAEPYLPQMLKVPVHPLAGTVTQKQRDQDRLLMTVTTDDGTILATFRKQISEIDLLVEEQDSITLDVSQYQPFLNDPSVLKVHKQKNPKPALPPSPSAEPAQLPDTSQHSSPAPEKPSLPPEGSTLP